MVATGIPLLLAIEAAADLVERALKTIVSTPARASIDLIHLEIVSVDTGL
jgi:hypothetical protein